MEDAIDTHVSLFGYSVSMAYRTLTGDDGLLTKWPMKNINRLQIEIYGVKRIARYSGIPLLQLFSRNSDSEVCAL